MATINKIAKKHGVSISEVYEVFWQSKPVLYRRGKTRYTAFGQTEAGRFLIVGFSLRSGGKGRVLTARDMTKKERGFYIKQRGGD